MNCHYERPRLARGRRPASLFHAVETQGRLASKTTPHLDYNYCCYQAASRTEDRDDEGNSSYRSHGHSCRRAGGRPGPGRNVHRDGIPCDALCGYIFTTDIPNSFNLNTAGRHTYIPNTGVLDTGSLDTDLPNTGSLDTASVDTDIPNTGILFRGTVFQPWKHRHGRRNRCPHGPNRGRRHSG